MGNPFSLSSLYEVILTITSWRYFEMDMFTLQKLSFLVTLFFAAQIVLNIHRWRNWRSLPRATAGSITSVDLCLAFSFSSSDLSHLQLDRYKCVIICRAPFPEQDHVNSLHRDKEGDWVVLETKIWGEQWFENNENLAFLRIPCFLENSFLWQKDFSLASQFVNLSVPLKSLHTALRMNYLPSSDEWSCLYKNEI